MSTLLTPPKTCPTNPHPSQFRGSMRTGLIFGCLVFSIGFNPADLAIAQRGNTAAQKGRQIAQENSGDNDANLDSAEKLTPEHHREVIERVGEMLDQFYVFPEVGKKCGAHLIKELEADQYSKIEDLKEFAEAVNKSLQLISKDKHLRIHVRKPERAKLQQTDGIAARFASEEKMRQSNYAVAKLEILEGNVGYMDMHAFWPGFLVRDTITSAMGFLSNSDAIIFDMRKNGGGYPETVQLICSYFFDKPTHLNSLYFRQGDRTIDFWTLDKVDGKRMPNVPIYILTSKTTFSGAEEFCYNLQTQKRATLIGETTRGGANPGQLRPINDQFEVFIPLGRAINPITKTNWEGTGVKPHIEVNADKALEVALKKAQKSAEDFRKTRPTRLTLWNDIKAAIESTNAQQKDDKDNQLTKQATQKLRDALEKGVQEKVVDVYKMNFLGFQQLRLGNTPGAMVIFKVNTESFPELGHSWEGLADAYREIGKTDLALKYYRKVLTIEPKNENAKGRIQQLKSEN